MKGHISKQILATITYLLSKHGHQTSYNTNENTIGPELLVFGHLTEVFGKNIFLFYILLCILFDK